MGNYRRLLLALLFRRRCWLGRGLSLPFCTALGHDCGGVLVMQGLPCGFFLFGGLLFFFFFLGNFLDARELSQNLHALFGSFSAAIQLDGKDFFHDLVEFWPARHAQSFQFSPDNGQRDANGMPFVEE